MKRMFLLPLLVLALLPFTAAIDLDTVGACTILDECSQLTEPDCIIESFTMDCSGFMGICLSWFSPYKWEAGPCPEIPPVDNTLGACLLATGECADSTTEGMIDLGNMTKTLCDQIAASMEAQFFPGAHCVDFVGACFIDFPDIGPILDDVSPEEEEMCSQVSGTMMDGRCCIDDKFYGMYMNELICTSNVAGEWKGLGTTCTDDSTEEVPEFGLIGGLMIVGLLGLFLWKRR